MLQTLLGIFLIVFIIFAIIVGTYKIYDRRLNHWRIHLKPGSRVHFYINENRLPGIVMNVTPREVMISSFGKNYWVPLNEIYY